MTIKDGEKVDAMICKDRDGKVRLAVMPRGSYPKPGDLIESEGVRILTVVMSTDFVDNEELHKIEAVFGKEAEKVTGYFSRRDCEWED